MAKDTTIVLSHGSKEDTILSSQSRQRTDLGIGHYKNGLTTTLIMSGGCVPYFSLGEAMKRYALEQGVPPEAIITEELSLETVGQLVFCKIGITDPKQMKDISIISSDYHMQRVKNLSDVVFSDNYLIDFLETETPLTDEERLRLEANEKRSEELNRPFYKEVIPGNNKQLLKFLFEQHGLYKTNPRCFKEGLEELIAMHK